MDSAEGSEAAARGTVEAGASRLTQPEKEMVRRLRDGDEAAFTALVEQYTPSLRRVALMYLKDRETANDVVQETWLGVLGSIARFEGRSSLKTWLFRILVKRALTGARRDGRATSFSALATSEAAGMEDAVDPDRFIAQGQPGAGGWSSIAPDWTGFPEERLMAGETMSILSAAIERLPEAQKMVITLRDLEHWTAAEVCNAMEISETNQRVLLHRARSKVRKALAGYLTGENA